MNTITARTQSGLTPYTGLWTKTEIIHLLRRATFGANKNDINTLLQLNMSQAVDLLLIPLTAPAPPLNDYDANGTLDPNVPYGQTWVNAAFDVNVDFLRSRSWFSWWHGLILNQPPSLTEKMTLFWHNHFATESSIIERAHLIYWHNSLLRANCLGNFKVLTKLVTIDPGMLKYLNGYKNSNTAPDENYARELQELFTVGKTNGIAPYSEDDVKMAAKVLTGYRIDYTTGQYYFDPTKHDTTNKTFSAFYNNTTIAGQTGTAGANELDDLLDMIFSKDEVALSICRKLYRFFVYYEIDATTETNVIQPLATVFRNNNYDISPVLSTLFKSEHFFDMANRGCVIRPPSDFVLGLCRELEVQFPDATDVETQYKLWATVGSICKSMQQELGSPPSVAGWQAYYQSPQYHEMWINSVSLPARANFIGALIGGYTVNGFTFQMNMLDFVQNKISNPYNPNIVIQECCEWLLGVDVSQTTKDGLKYASLLSGQSQDVYWTSAWSDYVNDPTNTTYINTVKTRLQVFFWSLLNIAECQLS